MTYFVFYTIEKYLPFELEEFSTEAEVIALLDRYAGNTDFEFRVVQGHEIKFKPVEVATKFVRAEG